MQRTDYTIDIDNKCYELSITLSLTIFVRNDINVKESVICISLLRIHHCIRNRYIEKDCQVTSLGE